MLSVSPLPQRKMKKNCYSGGGSGQNIKVFVRVRPINDAEKASKAFTSVECANSKEIVVQERPQDKYSKKFSFDKVFDGKSKQVDIYKSVAKPLVEEVLNGFNCTIFAYGQTGTGKTFTMEGDHYVEGSSFDENHGAGIIPRCVNELFDELRIQKLEFTMRVSFLELYNEELFDLLSAQDDLSKLRLFEDSTRKGSCIIQGLEEVLVRNKSDVYNIIEKGSAKRQTAATFMNAHSSRSHTVFTVTVHIKENTLDGDELLKTGKLHLVDLAGSENIGRSGAIEKRAREAGNINQSLLTLGRVITSLVEKAPHVPYRESKLTRLLQDALGGRTKTSIIATVSPASTNFEETASTLDYAHRAKNIQNKPEVNQKLNKKELIGEYTNEIEKLRRDLLAMREKNGVYLANENYQEIMSTMEQQAQEISEKISQIRALELELEKQMEIFSETKNELLETNEKLKETESKYTETKEVLQCTQKLLSKTAFERDEQKYLVSAHVKTESELLNKGGDLIDLAKTTTNDISELHNKIDRKRTVENINEDVGNTFSKEFEEKISAMNASIQSFHQYHNKNYNIIIGELGKYLSSSNFILESQLNELKEMNSVIINAFNNTHLFFVKKGEEMKENASFCCNDIQEKTSSEERMVNLFIERVFQPFTQQMSEIRAKQNKFVRSLEEGIYIKLNELRKHCLNVKEEENVLLQGMETKLEELIPFPALLADQINQKSKKIEDTTKAHSLMIRDLLKNLEEEADRYDKLIGNELPVLSSEQELSIFRAEQSSKDLLCDVEKLTNFSSENSKFLFSKQEEIKSLTGDEVNKFSEESINMEKEIIDMGSKSKEHTNRQILALNEISEKSDEFRNNVEKNISSLENHFKKSIEETSQEISSTIGAFEKGISRYGDEMNKVISLAQEDLSKSEAQLEKFFTDHGEELRECGDKVQYLFAEQLVKDIPTGLTPSRREYLYPEHLAKTSPHEKLLSRFRIKMNSGSKIPLPSFNQDEETEFAETSPDSTSSNSSLIMESSISSCGNNVSSGEKFPIPLSRSASLKENEFVFTHPAVLSRHESKEQLSSKQNSLSRSSSTSSLTDSKENVNVTGTRRTASTKRREIKPPSTVTTTNAEKLKDSQQTRERKILGSFN